VLAFLSFFPDFVQGREGRREGAWVGGMEKIANGKFLKKWEFIILYLEVPFWMLAWK
jgi:hypothetical protein